MTLELIAAAARTPVGLTAESSAAAVRAGISRLREFSFVTADGTPLVLGSDPLLDRAAEGRDRMATMLEAVLDEILRKAGPRLIRRDQGCDVLLAVPENRPGFTDKDADALCRAALAHLNGRGVRSRGVVAARGHAGALAAVRQAIERVERRETRAESPFFLVLGVDSYLHSETLLWLETEQRLALPGIPNGFMPGEAASGVLLATKDVRAAAGLPCLAVVTGAGIAHEPLLRSSETGSFGIAIHDAVQRAASGLSLPRDAADAVYADINGERYRSDEWGFFALRGYRAMRSLAYLTPCDCWGDIGAAFGPMAMILAAQSFVRRYADGPRALVMAGSESGLRGAVFLESPRQT